MSIVTKKGDGGYTGLPGSGNSHNESRRVRKDDPYIECLGTLDELDAFLAQSEIALKAEGNIQFSEIIGKARKDLLTLIIPAITESFSGETTSAEIQPATEWLEQQISFLEKKTEVRDFIFSWTKPTSVSLNISRTVCRRCERCMVNALADNSGKTEKPVMLPWINRLSDLLFLLAVSVTQLHNGPQLF